MIFIFKFDKFLIMNFVFIKFKINAKNIVILNGYQFYLLKIRKWYLQTFYLIVKC